jgi:hypothetical protein
MPHSLFQNKLKCFNIHYKYIFHDMNEQDFFDILKFNRTLITFNLTNS